MFLFGSIKPIPPTTFARNLDKYIDIAGVKRITPHGFRHSHVSLLFWLGCDKREIAARVGDTIEVIEKTYFHLFEDKKSNTIKTLNSFKNSKK